MPETQSYEISYPSSRQLTFDVGKIGLAKHHVRALLEVDVTEARRLIRQSRHSGRKISFTKREILHLTVLIDHDVIDGVPAARFVDDLVKKLQAGAGLAGDDR
jgi:pyruvate/2-oxoglutarate dehydrogenase complex dihydrolipoamide acyltransferase (E2) component